MSDELTTFVFAAGETHAPVRVDASGRDPLFVAIDVTRLLEYADPDQAVRRHCRAPSKRRVGSPLGRAHDVTLTMIPERDIYRLIMRSQMPAAEQFEEWVVGTVLPARTAPTYSATAHDWRAPDDAATQ